MKPKSDHFSFKSVMTGRTYRPSRIDYHLNAYTSMVFRNARISLFVSEIRRQVEKAEKERKTQNKE